MASLTTEASPLVHAHAVGGAEPINIAALVVEGKETQGAPMSLIKDPSGETIVVAIRIKKHELAECLRRIPKDGTVHDALYNAFSFGLFAAYELESLDSDLLQKLVSEWREP